MNARPARRSRVYGIVLRFYPRDFRRRFVFPMHDSFIDGRSEARASGASAVLLFYLRTFFDTARNGLAERINPVAGGHGRGGGNGFRGGDRPIGGGSLSRGLDILRADLRYTFRNLARRPAFAAASILTLGLGIGVATAVYGLYNTLLVRPIPGLPEDERLVKIKFHEERPFNFTWVSYPNYLDLIAATTALEGAAGYRPHRANLAWAEAGAESVALESVTHNYFDFLRLPLAAGRGFTRSEGEIPAESRVAVIGHELWQSRMGADPTVIGKTFHLNRIPFTIVGIGPRGFRGVERFEPVDLWIPASAYGDVAPMVEPGPDLMVRRSQRLVGTVVGRLRPGETAEHAQAQVGANFAALVAEYPEENELMQGITPRVHADIAESISFTTETLRSMLRLLGWIVTAVLLIAGANAANLLFSRTLRRREEVGVRRALGASRGRLYRQFLTESVVHGLLGGAVGLLIAVWLTRWLPVSGLGARVPDIEGMEVDLRVLAFTVLVAVIVGLLTGLASTLVGSGAKVEGLGERGASLSRWQTRLRDGLTIAQFGISVVVVISALLLVRSIINLRGEDHGFDLAGIATFRISLDGNQYSDAEEEDFYRRLHAGLAQTPAVGSWSLVSPTPFGGARFRGRIGVEGTLLERGEEPTVLFPEFWVTGDYFETLGIPLLRGRMFASGDLEIGGASRREVVVNERLGRELFGDEDPLGKTMSILDVRSREYIPTPIVGVVPDFRDQAGSVPEPTYYTPWEESPFPGSTTLLIRPQDVETGIASVRELFHSIDPTLPVRIATLVEELDGSIRRERVLAEVSGFLATLALLLAGVGLYAVVSFSVTERTRELGIRIALGAISSGVFAIVVRRALSLAVIGVALGLGAAWALTRYLESRLYEVTPADPVAFGLGGLLLVALGIAAAIPPARRATRIDPLLAIRSE